ncbi:unnamed protein product [Cladocopium goreaui]|uniref:Mitochondrial carrier protein n=1 Tax=Cladocopium goreaui TaxID=2562237 RepID=A0A9P1CAW3_9DINO|nr:unnamed protein product [Cladocopium goreaui]
MDIVGREGIFGLWRGNLAVILQVMPYAGLQFMTFDQYQQALEPYCASHPYLMRFVAGAAAGATATTLTYPLDLLRTQMAISMTSLWDRMPHSSYTAAAEDIVRSEGVRGLYRGLMPTLLGILPHAGTSFLVFETLKPWTRDALGLRSERDLPIWARLMCGGMAGLMAQGASYPLHVVRRRMQVQGRVVGQSKYHSVMHALLTILRKEGFVKGLYKGSSLTLIKGPVSAACGFTANDFFKSMLLGTAGNPERCPPGGWPDGCEVVRDPSKALKKLTPIEHLMTGGAAGAVAKTVIAPADRVKILYQTNNERPFCWRGVRRTFMTIYKNTGVTGLWRGHCATLMQIIPKSATTYTTFDRYRHWITVSTTLDNVSIRFLAGASAGATACGLTYPLDMMRARMAAHWDMTPRYPNYFAAFERVLKEEGISSLYKGIRPTLLGIMPYAGLSFMAYETLKAQIAEDGDLGVHQRLLCGACAGIFAQSTTYPLDIIRRRMQVHPGLYRNELHAMREIYHTEGLVRGLFKGVSMNWIKGPIAVGVSFTVNDVLKKHLMRHH